MTDELLLETAERVFADTCTPAALDAAERDGWATGVWDAAAAVGLPWISVPESSGGAGGTLGDALAVLRVAGRHGAPIPLAETGVLGAWLLASAGLPVGESPMTVVPGRSDDSVRRSGSTLTGVAHRVPWARSVARVVMLVDGMVAAVPVVDLRVDAVANLAGEPRDTVTFDAVEVEELAPAPAGIDAAALRARGALTRVMLVAGALERVSEVTAGYARQRIQFGTPIARFQAVQALLVQGAEDAALVQMAAETAARAAERGPATFEIAAAKTLADAAALSAARVAHQAHGAIGVTREYLLHHYTRRLWAWRAEHASREWTEGIGRDVVAAGADRLYPTVAGGLPA